MSLDTIHGLAALTSFVLIYRGAWLAWGHGYAMLAGGAMLLSGVIYARTRISDAREPD